MCSQAEAILKAHGFEAVSTLENGVARVRLVRTDGTSVDEYLQALDATKELRAQVAANARVPSPEAVPCQSIDDVATRAFVTAEPFALLGAPGAPPRGAAPAVHAHAGYHGGAHVVSERREGHARDAMMQARVWRRATLTATAASTWLWARRSTWAHAATLSAALSLWCPMWPSRLSPRPMRLWSIRSRRWHLSRSWAPRSEVASVW